MQGQNMSDVIEQYLKAMLAAQRQVEISRAEVADQFNCVPSQINYVIKTRFTPERGYVVKSKRGGGGYIRIHKVSKLSDQSLVCLMADAMPERLTAAEGQGMLQQLYEAGVISRQTGTAMLNVQSDHTLAQADAGATARLRARVMLAFLDSLRYDR
ncbi:CtsR family transcriptional regulator [Lacticaseibacillus kribbianus]|uniref:CtsR family transcriptional regulator n=1 Tax=Lacticaseibacillus kribbianus TaxID=2926292 RepID=UPI001CD40317|nr:CtsR family transcriptional regulator [Lacticaseibacillus kribbianus]